MSQRSVRSPGAVGASRKRPSSSPVRCCASAALPPLPQASSLPPAAKTAARCWPQSYDGRGRCRLPGSDGQRVEVPADELLTALAHSHSAPSCSVRSGAEPARAPATALRPQPPHWDGSTSGRDGQAPCRCASGCRGMAPADRQARPWHAVRCPLLSGHHGCEERDNWRTDSRGQVGRRYSARPRHPLRRERRPVPRATTGLQDHKPDHRQRSPSAWPHPPPGDDHSISGGQQRSHDGLAVSCRGTPGRNRTGVHHDVRCRAYPSGDVGQRAAYCEPGT